MCKHFSIFFEKHFSPNNLLASWLVSINFFTDSFSNPDPKFHIVSSSITYFTTPLAFLPNLLYKNTYVDAEILRDNVAFTQITRGR